MRMNITRWIARIATLCVLGPIAAKLAQQLHAPDGSEHASFLVSESPVQGALVLGAVLMITFVSGVVIARLANRRESMLNMAFILGWVAWTNGRMGELFRVEQNAFVMLAIEGALIGVVVLFALIVATSTDATDDRPSRVVPSELFKGKGSLMLGSAALSALAVAWVFGQTDLPGQSIWAAFAGGIVAGLIGTMVMQSSGSGAKGIQSKRQDPELIGFGPMIAGVLLAGVLAPIIGMFVPGSSGVLDSIGSGSLPGWLAVSPVSWSVGALLGVPIGWGWVESTVAMHEPHPNKA